MNETLLMARRSGRPEHTPEAEPVLVVTTETGQALLILDDGDRLTFDATELRTALGS